MGRRGPTRGHARSRVWRSCAWGWHVPADTDSTFVEQRILEQAVRVVGTKGAITAWASLRWRGAAYFDGLGRDGRELPVPILRLSGGNPCRQGLAHISADQLGPTEIEIVRGIPCATIQRSVFDVMRYADTDREATVAAEMVAAAGLISIGLIGGYVSQRNGWTGVPQVRKALLLACDDMRSPQESRLRLCWLLDAELPWPVCNQPVFDLGGHLLGYPDLFDPVAGLVVEYDGAAHKDADRHRKDVAREERFRNAGLEYTAVVAGDLVHRGRVVDRLMSARRRAKFLPPESRPWTLIPPPWWEVPETLDQRLRRLGLAEALSRTIWGGRAQCSGGRRTAAEAGGVGERGRAHP